MSKLILKASDFQYPTREELQEVYKNTFDLHNFGFPSDNSMESMFSDRNIRDTYRDNNLHYWDGVLLNRNGALALTYQNAIVNYMRGFPEDLALFEHNHYINRLNFDYYAEIFYYHFSTVKDTIGQIINIYYGLNIDVKKIYFNKEFAQKIPNPSVSNVIKAFLEKTILAKGYRDSFTHRTPITYPDTRCSVEWETSTITYYSAKDRYVKSPIIKANMDDTVYLLAKMLDELKGLMP
jgi:hypothetical protein